MKKFLSALLLVVSSGACAPIANAQYADHQTADQNRVSQWYYHGDCKGMTPAQATSCNGQNLWKYHIGP